MERRELQRRMLESRSYWGLDSSDGTCRDIGRVGCHDITPQSRPQAEIEPGVPYYKVAMDTETGEITVTNFDAEGNQL